MQKRIIWGLILLSCNLPGQYTYEANQPLYDLHDNANDFQGELAYEVSDDGISPAIDLSFNFTFYGSTFSQARMATNGCLHFGNSGSYCSDYTPDPLNGQHTYTIYPFWTDLIRDSNSRMKSWGDSSKMIFGWYYLREYNRANTDNSFEIILWNNNSFDIRYRELEIINHDVLIGEVGSSKDNSYTYYYHDECNTGTTNSSTCVNTNWNNTAINTTLENGGSLYGSGSGNGVDCSNPLNDASCSGYADALLTQQCNITQLYSNQCPNYWQAYDDQQCDEDPQYASFCPGFRQEESVAFFDDRNVDFGFEDEQEQFATGIFIDDGPRHHEEEPFIVIDIFEEEMFPPFEEFGHDDFEDFFGGPEPEELIIFFEPDPLPFIDDFRSRHEDPIHQEDILIEQFVLQETVFVEDFTEPETIIAIETIEELNDWFEEERRDHHEEREERLVENDEPEEEFREEIFEEEAVEEVFEDLEEVFEELEEERLAEVEEEIVDEVVEELDIIENDEPASNGKLKSVALRVIKSAVKTATASVNVGSVTSQSNSSNTTAVNINTQASSSGSGGGISTSSSPSMSDQYASATAQNNQVLSMSGDVGGSVMVSITPMNTVDGGTEVVMADVQVQNVQGEIDTAVGGVMTQSEADQIADKIIAQNIEAQQEEMQEEQQATGEYSDESSLVALIGYVPQFNSYTQYTIPDSPSWYTSQDIYTSATINDNINAFYNYASTNINNLENMTKGQPKIWR